MKAKATVRQARALRRRGPWTERWLWSVLRGSRLGGLKFRRQVPLGPFIADFVCLRHRLVVEADGPFHDPELDARRDAWLRSQGFRVIRIPNGAVRATAAQLILDAVEPPTRDLCATPSLEPLLPLREKVSAEG